VASIIGCVGIEFESGLFRARFVAADGWVFKIGGVVERIVSINRTLLAIAKEFITD
jgi:hypothetical protein